MSHGSGSLAGSALSPAGQADLRDHNLAVIATLLGGSDEALSRADIVARTGLARATVSRLVQELVGARVVDELEPVGTDQRGRPASPLTLSRRAIAGIGLEVNVWYLAGRAVDLAGETVGEFRMDGDFAGRPAGETLRRLGDASVVLVSELRHAGIVPIGASLAVPGMISDGRDLAIAPNLGWRDLEPLELLGPEWDRSGVPVSAHNDANLQATAVAYLRPGRLAEQASFLYIAGDTGIGGAVVHSGQVATGEHGWAGEIGHTSINPSGPTCHCGSSGCLETYAGQANLMEAAGLRPSEGVEALIRLLRADDPNATTAVRRAGWALGIGIANVLNITDLSTVVLGTSLGRLLPWLLPALDKELTRRVLASSNRNIVINQGTRFDEPACTGGALKILNEIVARPSLHLSVQSARQGLETDDRSDR